MSTTCAPPIIRRLTPVLLALNADHAIVTKSLSAVPQSILTTAQANLSEHFAQMTDALDMLLKGF
ncbi:MAG: CcdB family protein [Paracoccaceae bacterium]